MPITIRQPTDADRIEAMTWPLWNCEPSVFEWGYAQTERCLLLEGEAKVEAWGKEFHFKAGDFVVFPKGLACRWHVLSAVKKHYTFDGD
ncbi:MAG TPA: cupin domain-containing protein [bacterium]|jgi:uncharacterized cupin superfamily protein|nr:cupin domain-containing protein [bacterium]